MIDLIVRTSIILAAAWVLSHLLTRATAATRHLVWHAAVVAVLAMPLLMALVPKVPAVPDVPVPAVLHVLTSARVSSVIGSLTEVGPSSTFRISGTFGPFGTSAISTLGTFGTIATLVYVLFGYVLAARRTRSARAAPLQVQHVADTLAASLNLGQGVPVRMLEDDRGPFTTGLLAATIVLPNSANGWHPERLRTVLLHELAHVVRRDCRSQALAQLACAIYWFNPLIWIAARALRRTREGACDDYVLTCGVAPHRYAAELLAIARARQQQLAAGGVLAMGHRDDLEGRVLAIVGGRRARVPARATRWVVATAVVVTTVATGSASVTPAAVQPIVVDSTATRHVGALRPTADAREKATLTLALDSSPDVIPALITALSDSDSQVREKAALGLALRGDDRVIAPLVAALADRDPQVREKAAIALGTTGSTDALAALAGALDDADPQVREKAVAGLTLLRLSKNPQRDGDRIRGALRGVVAGLLKLTE